MKKMLLMLLMSVLSITAFSQETAKIPGHRAFVYAGTNWAPHLKMSYSGEFGTWGIKSNTSFSVTYDVVPVGSTLVSYVGGKAYYTVHSEDKLCYMVYVAPKFALDGSNDQVIEFGFNPNYTLSKDFLLAVTLGNQVYNGTPLNLFLSGGIIYLFRK